MHVCMYVCLYLHTLHVYRMNSALLSRFDLVCTMYTVTQLYGIPNFSKLTLYYQQVFILLDKPDEVSIHGNIQHYISLHADVNYFHFISGDGLCSF